ncbi:Uncharacterised protein [Clostridioides difficile]|nr:Uncharacterised protein [Clostridioides difficile]
MIGFMIGTIIGIGLCIGIELMIYNDIVIC